jgi:hypothetical protein
MARGKFLSVETRQLEKELKSIKRKYKKVLQKPFKKVAEDLWKDVKRRGTSVPFKSGTGKQLSENIRMKPLTYKVGYQVYLMAYVAGWQNTGTQQRTAGAGRNRARRKELKAALSLRKLVAAFNIKKAMAATAKNRGKVKGRHYLQEAFEARKDVIVATIAKTKIDFEALKQ